MARLICLLAAVAALGIARPAAAQPAGQPNAEAPPTVITMLSSADDLIRNVEFVMSLTDPNDQQQTQVIKDYLDIFLIGIDTAKPMRMDVITDAQGPLRYRPSFPVPPQQLNRFTKDNLAGLGINNRRIAASVWSLGGAFIGFMRYQNGYASFAEQQFFRQDLPPDLPDPLIAIQPLLAKQYEMAADLRNDPAGVDFRHQLFQQKLRPELLKDLKPLQNESEDEFAVRKLLYEHRLEELERYYAEAAHGELGGRLVQEQKVARGDLHITPIPDTSLAESIQQLGQQPSYFAGIPRSENPILSARVNFPLDPMRQENLLEMWDLLRSIEKQNIEAETEPTAEQKQARQTVVDLIFDFLAANTREGLADFFAEAHENPSGKHTAVGGLRAVDGTKAVDILKAMTVARPERKIEIDTDQAGDVRIHTFGISEERRPTFDEFFGGGTVYVATSEKAVWLAAGENALEELKAAIEQAREPAENATPEEFVDVYARLLPWLKLQADQPEPDDPGNPNISKYRDLAVQAFENGGDVITMHAERAGNDIRGLFEAHEGILRFVGKAMAQFSRENLAEEEQPARAAVR